jgi:hypothetical protein
MPNIWTLDHETDKDADEKTDKEEPEQKEDSDFKGATVVHNDDETSDDNSFKDIEKPSFLRRLKKHKDSNNNSTPDKDK